MVIDMAKVAKGAKDLMSCSPKNQFSALKDSIVVCSSGLFVDNGASWGRIEFDWADFGSAALAVPIKEFSDLCSALAPNEAKMVDKGGHLVVTSKDKETGWQAQVLEDWKPPSSPEGLIPIPSNRLMNDLKISAASAAQEGTTYALDCVAVGGGSVRGTNGSMIYSSKLDDRSVKLKKMVLVPADALLKMIRMSPGAIGFDDHFMYLSRGSVEDGDRLIVGVRLADGRYPDTAGYEEAKGDPADWIKNIVDAVMRASLIVSDEQTRHVSVDVGAKSIKVRAQGASGWHQETIKRKGKGMNPKFSITPDVCKWLVEPGRTVEMSDKFIIARSENCIWITTWQS